MQRTGLALLLLCCTDKETEGASAGDGTSCTSSLVGTDPAADATAVPLTARPSATLSALDPSATLSLFDADGTPEDGASVADGDTLTFTPAAPLAPATAYLATVTACEGTQIGSAAFTTTAGDRLGQAYRIPLDLTNKGADTLLYSMLLSRTVDLLLKVTAQSADQLDLTAAVTYEATWPQNMCLPTMDIRGADFTSDPRVVTAPQDFNLGPSDGGPILRSMQIDATFTPDGAGLRSVRVTGDYDVRDYLPQWGELLGASDPALICNHLVGFGFYCDPCASDGEPFCIQMWTKGDTGTLESDAAVTCVSEELCHPDCATSTCDDPSAGLCD